MDKKSIRININMDEWVSSIEKMSAELDCLRGDVETAEKIYQEAKAGYEQALGEYVEHSERLNRRKAGQLQLEKLAALLESTRKACADTRESRSKFVEICRKNNCRIGDSNYLFDGLIQLPSFFQPVAVNLAHLTVERADDGQLQNAYFFGTNFDITTETDIPGLYRDLNKLYTEMSENEKNTAEYQEYIRLKKKFEGAGEQKN